MTGHTTSAEVDAILDRLAVSPRAADLDLLEDLQRAWVFAQPFHNLDLLAGYAEGRGPLDRRQAWLRCVDGLGGPCHVQASSFLLLLQALGFDAWFASAHITHPGDHLVVCVELGGARYICDVGNGHPYLRPFPLRSPLAQCHLQWRVRSGPLGDGVLVEQRTPGSNDWRRVYVATADRRTWDDFAPAISRHHQEIGFGPFLTGLRGVRVKADRAISLRDDLLARYHATQTKQERIQQGHEEVLADLLELRGLPIRAAVETWRRNTGRS
jgi:arylamine N-acetyltransferase